MVNATKPDGVDSTQFERNDMPHTEYFNRLGTTMSTPSSGTAFETRTAAKWSTSGRAEYEQ